MEWIHSICVAVGDYLHRVPDVVWAALIAASVAFFTTTLSNRNSRKQLQMQLDATARREKIEREMALRRDVYLPAAEAITRAHAALGRLTDVNVDHAEFGLQMVADLAAISKAQLIASDSTVQALMAYTNALMPAYLDLLKSRVPLIIRKNAIELEQTYIDAALTEHRRLVQLMKEYNLSGSSDRAPLERLDRQCKNELEVFQSHVDKQAAHWQEQRAAVYALVKKLAELMGPISAAIPDAMLSARRDLDLPIDEAAYRTRFAGQQKAAQAAMLGIEDQFNQVTPPAH